MFFYTNKNIDQIKKTTIHPQTRYNIDMMTSVRYRFGSINKYKNPQEEIQPEIKDIHKIEKIKSLKLVDPKLNRWNEDIFEQIKLEEQKNKIKHLKLREPKTIQKNTIQIDESDASDINDCEE